MNYFQYILFLFIYSSVALAYKIVIFTDQQSGLKAHQQLERFNTPPFDEFEIEYSVQIVPSQLLGCVVTNVPARGMVGCDEEYVLTETQRLNADQAIVMSTVGSRGSGGAIPVIPISRPQGTMLHEFLHTFGFSDEYTYDAELANIFCRRTHNTPNVSVIAPQNPYQSDAWARSLHGNEIPWFNHIAATTPIVNQTNLGTSSAFEQYIGLFESSKCANATPPIPMWRPNHAPTIMTDVRRDLGHALVPIMRHILRSQGARTRSTRYRLESSWFGFSERCYLEDIETSGERLRRLVPKRRCRQVPESEAILNDDRDTSSGLNFEQSSSNPNSSAIQQ